MTLYNPSIRRNTRHEQAGPLEEGKQLKSQIRAVREAVEDLLSFVRNEHLTVGTFLAFWRQEERAVLTLRAVGQSLQLDLVDIARSLFEQLDHTAEMSLADFQANEAAHLFATIDSIEPDEVMVGDGRSAAEKFQYAAEARSALLCHALAVLSQRYPATAFGSLAEATLWTRSFSALLMEAEEVILGTQQLLYDEATALQSYLDTLHNRFELLEEQARAAAVIIREDWRGQLEQAERKLLDLLARRHEQLEALAFGELREARESGWLQAVAMQTARHAPVVGSLLLTLAGGATLLTDSRPRLPDISLLDPVREGVDGLVRSFPVLPRRSGTIEQATSRAQDEISAFFSLQPRPRGRHTLTLENSEVLGRVLDELARFGYARRDVLKLLGLNSVNDLSTPMTLDVRWSQGGRPLLLPPYQPADSSTSVQAAESHSVRPGAPLSLIAQRFGFSVEQLVEENPLLGDPAAIQPGTSIFLPAQSWTQRSREVNEPAISWGASLNQIARELNVSLQLLADLNDIPNPDSWLYQGHRLRVPLLPEEVAPQPARLAAPAVPAPTTSPIQYLVENKPVSSLLVHRVEAGESLSALAERYDTTIAEIMKDNRLAEERLQEGQTLLVRVSGRVVATVPAAPATGGADLPTPRVPAAITTVADVEAGQALVARYGSTLFPSIEAMPEDLRDYFTSTVQEVADFFNVRPGDIIGILQAENNNAGIRVSQPAVSSAGARGVAQIIARTWNGWSNPEKEQHLSDMRSIERHGGLGFDWSMREAWRAWKNGESDGEILANSHADPNQFEDSIAGVARHLVHWGLTRDRAASAPEWFEQRLADSISVYNSGRPLAEAADFKQSAENLKTTGQYVSEAMAVAAATPVNLVAPADSSSLREQFRRQMDEMFGVMLSEQELTTAIQGSIIAADVTAGKLSAEEGARRLMEETVEHYLAEGRAAKEAGRPLPWPFVYNQETLTAQRLAVRYLGHALSAWEVETLVEQTGGDAEAMARALGNRGDARLFAGARRFFDEALKRSERGMPVRVHEVAAIVQPAMAGYDPNNMSTEAIQQVMEQIERGIRQLPEFRAMNGITRFSASPLSPMPRVIRSFGAAVNYQRGGKHTGIDVANPRVNNQEPPIFAVEDGTVVHVGPLYCDRPDACRGGKSIVIDHGNEVYSIYSHNSASSVQVGQRVEAGQEIGRQGDEGYSFGSHLHFEVHTGAPFTGDWEQPFKGGQFEDPMEWLPQG